jgi:hypothetical protein
MNNARKPTDRAPCRTAPVEPSKPTTWSGAINHKDTKNTKRTKSKHSVHLVFFVSPPVCLKRRDAKGAEMRRGFPPLCGEGSVAAIAALCFCGGGDVHAPVTSLRSAKNAFLRSVLMPQFAGGHW